MISVTDAPSIGGFWFAFAATMIPAFNAAGEFLQICSCFKENPYIYAAPYSSSSTDTVSGLSSPEFMDSFGMYIYYCSQLYLKILTGIPAFLFLTMAILMLIFMIGATRTNIVYTLIFLSLILVFLLLTAGYWQLAEGNTAVGDRCIKVSSSHNARREIEVLIHMHFL
jgi:uncharacterized protein